MLDTYSKIVLTVIAVALSAIAIQQFVAPATALTGCGSARLPCFIMSEFPIPVTVED